MLPIIYFWRPDPRRFSAHRTFPNAISPLESHYWQSSLHMKIGRNSEKWYLVINWLQSPIFRAVVSASLTAPPSGGMARILSLLGRYEPGKDPQFGPSMKWFFRLKTKKWALGKGFLWRRTKKGHTCNCARLGNANIVVLFDYGEFSG